MYLKDSGVSDEQIEFNGDIDINVKRVLNGDLDLVLMNSRDNTQLRE